MALKYLHTFEYIGVPWPKYQHSGRLVHSVIWQT